MINVIKQTIAQVRAQKMLSIISVVGTALSIFLIMVVVMLQQVKVVPLGIQWLHLICHCEGSLCRSQDPGGGDGLYPL